MDTLYQRETNTIYAALIIFVILIVVIIIIFIYTSQDNIPTICNNSTNKCPTGYYCSGLATCEVGQQGAGPGHPCRVTSDCSLGLDCIRSICRDTTIVIDVKDEICNRDSDCPNLYTCVDNSCVLKTDVCAEAGTFLNKQIVYINTDGVAYYLHICHNGAFWLQSEPTFSYNYHSEANRLYKVVGTSLVQNISYDGNTLRTNNSNFSYINIKQYGPTYQIENDDSDVLGYSEDGRAVWVPSSQQHRIQISNVTLI